MNDKSKKISSILLLAMIAVMAIALVPRTLSISTFPDIVVTLINQEPDPVSPGNAFDVRFRIENTGSDPANNVEVKLVTAYPVSVYGGQDSLKSLGTLTYSTGGQDYGVVEKWKLYADPNAATGENKVEFWYRIDKGSWTKAGEYTVNIRSPNAFLAINQIKTVPERLVPGTATQVSFVLENMASNELKDITLSLSVYSSTVTAAGVTITELPFTPLRSGNEKTIDRIAAGKSQEITFDLFTDADAASKVYKIPYTLEYSDASGTNFTKSGVLGLLVDSDPEMSVYIEKSEAMSAGAKGDVTIKIVNKGFSDIKFLDVKLNEGSGFKILSTPEAYVGKLDSDDYETVDYTILIDSNAKDPITLPVSIDYRDANGHLYQKEMAMPLKLYTAAELKQNNGSSGTSFWLIAILIVAVVAAVWIYRKVKKNSRRKA